MSSNVKVNDIVRFLNEKGGGRVTRIKDKYVYVLTDEGFEIPLLHNQLVVVGHVPENTLKTPPVKQNTDFQVSYNFVEREESFELDPMLENSNLQVTDLNNELFLAIVNVESNMQFYLINTGTYYIYFHAGAVLSSNYVVLDNGRLEPGIQTLLLETPLSKAVDYDHITIQALFFHPNQGERVPAIDRTLKASYRLAYNAIYTENDFFDEPACIVNLLENKSIINDLKPISEKELLAKEKTDDDKSARFKKRPAPVTVEVDLHIEQLLDTWSGMNNHEIVTYQLGHFRKELESAIKNKVSRIIFIHGVGNGSLKLQLRKQLDDLYPFLIYQDASYAEYGFGATMVILDRYKK